MDINLKNLILHFHDTEKPPNDVVDGNDCVLQLNITGFWLKVFVPV